MIASRSTRRWALVLSGLLAVVLHAQPVVFNPVAGEADRVVIVANANDADSLELARFYSDRRGIPRENIVALDLPVGEEINWPTYVSQLLEPLRNWLVERDRHGPAGRRRPHEDVDLRASYQLFGDLSGRAPEDPPDG